MSRRWWLLWIAAVLVTACTVYVTTERNVTRTICAKVENCDDE